MHKRNVWLSLAAAGLVCLAVAGAWAFESIASRIWEPYTISVVRNTSVLATFDIGQLEALGMKRVKMQGKYEEGPPLLAVLEAAGARDFETVSIVGLGVRDSGRLELAREDIDHEVLIDIANRGTCKIAGPNIAWGDRVRDITRIEVR